MKPIVITRPQDWADAFRKLAIGIESAQVIVEPEQMVIQNDNITQMHLRLTLLPPVAVGHDHKGFIYFDDIDADALRDGYIKRKA